MLSGDDDLLWSVDSRDFDACFSAYFGDGDFVDADECGHSAGSLVTCELHKASAFAYEFDGVGDGEDAGDDESGVFAEAVSGGHVGDGDGVGGFLDGLPSGDGCGEDCGLGVLGACEFVGGAFEHYIAEFSSEGVVDFVEDCASGA